MQRGRGSIQRQARTSVAAKSSPLKSNGAFIALANPALAAKVTSGAVSLDAAYKTVQAHEKAMPKPLSVEPRQTT